MAREKPREKETIWGCDHHYPIEVAPVGGGKRARCLGCGACGPVRAAGEDAMLALRAEFPQARERGPLSTNSVQKGFGTRGGVVGGVSQRDGERGRA